MKDKFTFLFSDFTFEAASDYIKEKLPLTKQSFKILSEKYKRGAFTVAGYTKADIVSEIYNSLIDSIQNGSTIEEFKVQVNTFLEDKGYEGLSAFRADNIFRTNIQTAYQVGHYESMAQPEAKKLRPYWRYEAVGDSRTRPSHLALDGKIYPADSPIWDTWYPPNGYRCRCTVTSLSERQVKERGLKVSADVPSSVVVGGRRVDVTIDDGFDYNPAKKEWRPNMGEMPKEIRAAYLEQKKGYMGQSPQKDG